MRVIFVNRFFFPDESATSQLLTDLARHLAAAGKSVHVVTGRQRYDDPGADLPATESVAGVRVHRVWATRFGRSGLLGRAVDYLTFYIGAAALLSQVARRGDVVVAKTDPPLISVVADLCCRLRGARLVNWVQDVFPETAQVLGVKAVGGIVGGALRRLRVCSLRRAALTVALGRRMAEYLASEGVDADKLVIIPNWVDGDAIRPLAREDNPLRAEWALEGKFVVGYSGNMGRAHEFETFLRAAELVKDDVAIAFVFIGDGHGSQQLKRAAAQRGLTSVQFRPLQPRAALRLSLTLPDVHLVSLRPEMEAFALPSKFYGIIAAGRPAVFVGALDGELARELARFDCGLAVTPDDAAALAAFLRRLKAQPALAEDMGRRARAGFEGRYDKAHAMEAWERRLAGLGA